MTNGSDELSCVETIHKALILEREKPHYASAQRRERKQEMYVGSCRQAGLDFLAFALADAALAEKMADAVTRHATPVGSGTVARTDHVPIPERAAVRLFAH